MSSRRHRTRHSKLKLANRLANWPFLRILLFKVWFRRVVLLLVGVIGFSLALIPKWRVVTPEGFNPEIKLSGLDYFQWLSLKRTARRAMLEGKWSAASSAWRGAAANDPTDPEALRGGWETLLQRPDLDHQEFNRLLPQATWMLRLHQTNAVDTVILAKTYARYQIFDWVQETLDKRPEVDTPDTRLLRLLIAFYSGQETEFNVLWDRLPGDEQASPFFKLYRLALDASSHRSPDVQVASLGQLETFMANPSPVLAETATRLTLAAYSRRSDLERYQEIFRQLSIRRWATVRDHVLYWKFLYVNGAVEEARGSARQFSDVPHFWGDAVQVMRLHLQMNLKEEAIEFVKPCMEKFPKASELWLIYGETLIDLERWSELQGVALDLRHEFPTGSLLHGLGYFLEGRAEMGLGRREVARQMFGQMEGTHFEQLPSFSLSLAKALKDWQEPKLALHILQMIEPFFPESEPYWDTLFQVSVSLKNSEFLVRSAEQALRLNPEKPEAISNYGAALILTRQRPEEAIRHTFRILTLYPQSPVAQVNHALALALNHRTDEAVHVLESVKEERLDPGQRNAFHLAQFEILILQGKDAEAKRLYSKIERSRLFPNQKDWFEDQVYRLDPPPLPISISE